MKPKKPILGTCERERQQAHVRIAGRKPDGGCKGWKPLDKPILGTCRAAGPPHPKDDFPCKCIDWKPLPRKEKEAMKTKINYGKCHIEVQGVDMNCPLCGVLVKSGSVHDCAKGPELPLPRKRKAGR